MNDTDLDDLFDDIRQTCSECEHPRCLAIIKSAKEKLQPTNKNVDHPADVTLPNGDILSIGTVDGEIDEVLVEMYLGVNSLSHFPPAGLKKQLEAPAIIKAKAAIEAHLQAAVQAARIDEQERTGVNKFNKDSGDIVFFQHDGSTYVTQEQRLQNLKKEGER